MCETLNVLNMISKEQIEKTILLGATKNEKEFTEAEYNECKSVMSNLNKLELYYLNSVVKFKKLEAANNTKQIIDKRKEVIKFMNDPKSAEFEVNENLLSLINEYLNKHNPHKNAGRKPLSKAILQIDCSTDEVVAVYTSRAELMSKLPINMSRLSNMLVSNRQNTGNKNYTKWYDKKNDNKRYFFIEK